jgi:hypothetical protein
MAEVRSARVIPHVRSLSHFEWQVEGGWVDRVVGARGRPDGERDGGDPGRQRTARADQSSTPRRAGAATGARGRTLRASAISHSQSTTSTPLSLALRARGAELVGDLERYGDSYRLCYVRGPEGIIVELAEQIG